MHAATGGVGSAAVQVCSALGCPVLASAGSPGKRALLRAQKGVAATASSRDIDFVDLYGCDAPAGASSAFPRTPLFPNMAASMFFSVVLLRPEGAMSMLFWQ